MGVNLLWFIVLGLLTFFAEIRVGFVKETILKPFGFLHSYVGRANFYLFFGSIVTSSGQQNSYALAEGIMIVVLGVIQLLMAFFMSKKVSFAPGVCWCAPGLIRALRAHRVVALSRPPPLDAVRDRPARRLTRAQPKTGTKKPYESVAPPGTTPSPPSGPSAPAGPGGPSSKADFSSASAATPSLGATGTKSQHSTDGASSTDNPFLNV